MLNQIAISQRMSPTFRFCLGCARLRLHTVASSLAVCAHRAYKCVSRTRALCVCGLWPKHAYTSLIRFLLQRHAVYLSCNLFFDIRFQALVCMYRSLKHSLLTCGHCAYGAAVLLLHWFKTQSAGIPDFAFSIV